MRYRKTYEFTATPCQRIWTWRMAYIHKISTRITRYNWNNDEGNFLLDVAENIIKKFKWSKYQRDRIIRKRRAVCLIPIIVQSFFVRHWDKTVPCVQEESQQHDSIWLSFCVHVIIINHVTSHMYLIICTIWWLIMNVSTTKNHLCYILQKKLKKMSTRTF